MLALVDCVMFVGPAACLSELPLVVCLLIAPLIILLRLFGLVALSDIEGIVSVGYYIAIEILIKRVNFN